MHYSTQLDDTMSLILICKSCKFCGEQFPKKRKS